MADQSKSQIKRAGKHEEYSTEAINDYRGDTTAYTEITMEKIDELDDVLGKRVEAYFYEDDELMLRFEDGTILQWSGYYSRPLDADSEELREIWEERAESKWVAIDDE